MLFPYSEMEVLPRGRHWLVKLGDKFHWKRKLIWKCRLQMGGHFCLILNMLILFLCFSTVSLSRYQWKLTVDISQALTLRLNLKRLNNMLSSKLVHFKSNNGVITFNLCRIAAGVNTLEPRDMHICIRELGHCSDNGLVTIQRQVITWGNVKSVSLSLLGTNLSEICIKTWQFPLKIHLIMWPFCSSVNKAFTDMDFRIRRHFVTCFILKNRILFPIVLEFISGSTSWGDWH